MSIILKHEKRFYKNQKNEDVITPTQSGDGFIESVAEIIPKVTNFISKNKDIISDGGKAISSVSNAASKIADTVKKSNQLKELQLIREQRNNKLSEQSNPTVIPSQKTGKGFKIIG